MMSYYWEGTDNQKPPFREWHDNFNFESKPVCNTKKRKTSPFRGSYLSDQNPSLKAKTALWDNSHDSITSLTIDQRHEFASIAFVYVSLRSSVPVIASNCHVGRDGDTTNS